MGNPHRQAYLTIHFIKKQILLLENNISAFDAQEVITLLQQWQANNQLSGPVWPHAGALKSKISWQYPF
jgi:hypothetical protein